MSPGGFYHEQLLTAGYTVSIPKGASANEFSSTFQDSQIINSGDK